MTVQGPNEFNYRKGDTQPVFATPDAATVIRIGDLCVRDPVTGKPKPVSDVVWQGSIELTQDAAQNYFLGVAEQQYDNSLVVAPPGSVLKPIRFQTAGEAEFDIASATPTLGQMFTFAKATGNALERRKVVSTTDPNKAIGRCAREYSAATTKVILRIFSTIMGNPVAVPAGSSSGAI